ncbi:uncharacterized protein E0L32_011664 [Thyridium curvatum]|uniref:DUF6536 domain-containing protein n=1 Tax=Thyridium curvatum TaxID=1093900 RepID=A0A507BG04_9PEZI|nr:uncharacterized protein E0L32_011664 [Thyridium curvatum]TPX18423.1 hypothetical protein E0L32_011664 [Thyridium curvatum]
MEVVIPPRDHGPTTYKYEWDENGEVISTQRITDPAAPPPPTTEPSASRRGRARQTVMWPFQGSVATDSMISSPLAAHFPSFRRATWQARGLMGRASAAETDSTLIPDYVVNYIRGETPETVARRKRNGGKLAERDVDIEHQHKPQRSQAALREFYDGAGGGAGGSGGGGGAGYHRGSGVSGSSSEIERVMLAHVGDGEKPVHRPPRRFAHGWRGGVALNAILGFLVLLVGIICLVLAVVQTRAFAGETKVMTGSCASVDGLNRGLHVIISVLVLVVVAGASYVFQVLTSPTRPELAAAHERKRWLDVGIPSLRNLGAISTVRSILALTVVAAAVATQVIYNSVIFTTKVGADPRLVFVTQSFLTGETFSNATSNNAAGLSRIDILNLQKMAGSKVLVNMTIEECMDEFDGAFNAEFTAALFVTDIVAPSSSVLQTTTQASLLSLGAASEGRDSIIAARAATQFCLAQRDLDGHTCDLSLNGSLLAVVVLLNIITILATTAILFRSSFRPLVTIGDAIASFLEDPDHTTEGSCLMTKADVLQNRWGLGEAKHWQSRRHFWFRSASVLRWLSWGVVWLLRQTAAVRRGLAAQRLPPPIVTAKARSSYDRQPAPSPPSDAVLHDKQPPDEPLPQPRILTVRSRREQAAAGVGRAPRGADDVPVPDPPARVQLGPRRAVRGPRLHAEPGRGGRGHRHRRQEPARSSSSSSRSRAGRHGAAGPRRAPRGAGALRGRGAGLAHGAGHGRRQRRGGGQPARAGGRQLQRRRGGAVPGGAWGEGAGVDEAGRLGRGDGRGGVGGRQQRQVRVFCGQSRAAGSGEDLWMKIIGTGWGNADGGARDSIYCQQDALKKNPNPASHLRRRRVSHAPCSIFPPPAELTRWDVEGLPGSGKRKLCKRLEADYGFVHIAIDAHLQELILEAARYPPDMRTADENLIQLYCDRGDQLPRTLLFDKMYPIIRRERHSGHAILLDNFPSQIQEAGLFEAMTGPPDQVLFFDCPKDTAKERFMSWNTREGDTAPAFFERIYESFTKCNPEIVAEYERKGLLTKIDTSDFNASYGHLKDALEKTGCMPKKGIWFPSLLDSPDPEDPE